MIIVKEPVSLKQIWEKRETPFEEVLKKDQLEYTSLINIRPAIGNRSMEIVNPSIRKKIRLIVAELLK